MTSVHECRYALWFHPSQVMQTQIEWRETPRSHNYVAIVAPAVLPGTATVVNATKTQLELRIDEQQVSAIHSWTGALPAAVLYPSACETRVISHSGPYNVVGPNLRVTSTLPEQGARVCVRLVASVQRVGCIHKTVLRVTDVLQCDVAADAV